MSRALILLAAAACGGLAAAQSADPLQSPTCTRALEALRAHEAELPASGAAPRAVLDRHAALKKQAARACLGGRGDAPPPPRSLRAPVVVPPAGVQVPPPAPAVQPSRPSALPPRQTGAPLIVTRCEAAGCWTSDGAYMPRAGAHLFGPRGLCSVQGNTVHCP